MIKKLPLLPFALLALIDLVACFDVLFPSTAENITVTVARKYIVESSAFPDQYIIVFNDGTKAHVIPGDYNTIAVGQIVNLHIT